VGPGAHFLASSHTHEHFRTAFYHSTSSDNNSYEQWRADGGADTAKRANAHWKRLLDEYVDPGLDPSVDEALREYIARRKSSYPDRNYY
jgi:trimethylamine--corrinoid protein Co-methyltransferase